MAARVKYPVIDRKIVFQGNGVFSPEIRARAFAEMARASIEEIDSQNDATLGRDIQYKTFVDGKPTENLFIATDKSEISARWELASSVVAYIDELLSVAGPVLKGRYRKLRAIYADGVEIDDPDKAIGAKVVTFVPLVPYARKIERGRNRYSPGKVYESVAAMAKTRFSNVAQIKFSYREPEGASPLLTEWAAKNASIQQSGRKQKAQMQKNMRQPAIVVYL